jgi:hypothetical protein
LLRGGESPLSGAAAFLTCSRTGMVMGGPFKNRGGRAMRALHG